METERKGKEQYRVTGNSKTQWGRKMQSSGTGSAAAMAQKELGRAHNGAREGTRCVEHIQRGRRYGRRRVVNGMEPTLNVQNLTAVPAVLARITEATISDHTRGSTADHMHQRRRRRQWPMAKKARTKIWPIRGGHRFEFQRSGAGRFFFLYGICPATPSHRHPLNTVVGSESV